MSDHNDERRPGGDGTALAESAGRADHHGRRRVAIALAATAATAPAVLRLGSLRGADERTVNEVTGWLARAAALGALHNRAPVVDLATLELLGGARTPVLVRMATQAGLLTRFGGDVYRVQPTLARTVWPDRGEG